MKALIIGGGDFFEISQEFFNNKYIICADRGYDYALKNNIHVDFLVGDMDSINKENKKDLNIKNIRIYPVKKDKSDMEIAIDLAIEKGYKDIEIIGAIGSRMDHSITNIFSLKKFYKNKINIKIYNETNTIIYTEEDIEIIKEKDKDYISFINIEDTSITLEGFEYNLKDYQLEIGSSLQISNRIVENKGLLKVNYGGVFVIQSKD